MKTSIVLVYFINKSTYVVVSEEQKAFLYLLPQKVHVWEYVPVKQTFFLHSPVEIDTGFFLKLLLSALDSSNTLTLAWFFHDSYTAADGILSDKEWKLIGLLSVSFAIAWHIY